MASKFKTPGGDRTFLSLLLLLGNLFQLGLIYFRKPPARPELPAIFAGLAIAGAGLWFKKQWARFLGIILSLYFSAFFFYHLFVQGFSLKRLFYAAAPTYVAWWIWRAFSPQKIAEEEDEQKPMISMVLLLKQPRYLEARVLAEIVSSAWGGKYTHGDDASEKEDAASQRWVVGESPLFMIQSPHGMFILNNFSIPYFNDKEAVVKEINELRLRKAVEDHNAWLSVDLMALPDENADRSSAYPYIAKLVAELGGEDCTAILQPESQRINVWDDELVEKLRGPNAVEEFAVPTNIPVQQIADDDPEMIKAVSEAKARWPEFVEAFKKKDGENFAVKAPITVEENREFIWINVIGLEPEYIHGTLGNDPVNLGNLKYGDRVEVPLKDLNDWGYIKNEAPVGMFTVKILMAARKKG